MSRVEPQLMHMNSRGVAFEDNATARREQYSAVPDSWLSSAIFLRMPPDIVLSSLVP